MTDLATIDSTIRQYGRHGWILRRASLPQDLIGEIRLDFPEVEFSSDAEEFLWFSRRTLADREAWELRRLSGPPFALVVVLDDSLSTEEREDALRNTQRQMFDGSHPEPTAH